MGAMWNGNINIKYAAQICTTTISVHHWKGAVTLLWFYWIYIMVSVTCLTRSVVYHVYTYEYIFVSLLVLNSIALYCTIISVSECVIFWSWKMFTVFDILWFLKHFYDFYNSAIFSPYDKQICEKILPFCYLKHSPYL